MSQEYFEKVSNMFKNAQEPFQALAELNAKTIQSYSYPKPEDFSKVAKPEEFLEKQLELAISNGHKALEYMQKSFQIIEKALVSFNQETKVKAESKSKQ